MYILLQQKLSLQKYVFGNIVYISQQANYFGCHIRRPCMEHAPFNMNPLNLLH